MTEEEKDLALDLGVKTFSAGMGALYGGALGGPLGAVIGAAVTWTWQNIGRIHEHDMEVDPAHGYFHP